jgi:glutathione S-transferase
MEIFWGSGSGPAWRVLLAAEIKKIPYTSRLLSFTNGEHKTPEMLALNPRGKVPVLRDGNFSLYESVAILAYLDAKYPEPSLFGKTPEEIGITWRMVLELEHYAGPALSKVSRPLLFRQLPEKEAEVLEGRAHMHDELAKLEAQLQGHTWLGGNRISAADVVALPFLMQLLRGANRPEAAALDLGIEPLERHYPRLATWKAYMEALPGYERTFPPHWRDV